MKQLLILLIAFGLFVIGAGYLIHWLIGLALGYCLALSTVGLAFGLELLFRRIK